MAKTHGPLLSINASGTVGKTNTYSRRSSGNQVRYQRKQKDAFSPKQLMHREKIWLMHFLWSKCAAADKTSFNNAFPSLNIPGYNAFIKINLARYNDGLAYIKNMDGTTFDAFYDLPAVKLPFNCSNRKNTANMFTAYPHSTGVNQYAIQNTFSGISRVYNTTYGATLDVQPAGYWGAYTAILNSTGTKYLRIIANKSNTIIKTIAIAPAVHPSFLTFQIDSKVFWAHSTLNNGLSHIDLADINSYAVTANPGGGYNAGFYCDFDGYLYGVTNENPCKILRWRISDYADTESAEITGTNANTRTIAASENFLYTYAQGTPDKLFRINRKTMAAVESVESTQTGKTAHSMFVCSGKIYVVEYGKAPAIQIFTESPLAFSERITDAFALSDNYWDRVIMNCPVWRKDTAVNTPRIYIP